MTERIFESPGTSNMSTYIWRIALILLVAFLLGYVFRLLLNSKLKARVSELEIENQLLTSKLVPEISEADIERLKGIYATFFFDILGLKTEESIGNSNELTDELMDLIIDFRTAAKIQKDHATADKIRDKLKSLNIEIKDQKEGASWSFEN